MKELFEKYIRKIYMADDESFIILDVIRGKKLLKYETVADCCSETWFADIIGVENLIGEEVIGIIRLELPSPQDNRSRQDYDEAYGIRLQTKKGDCDFIYRNSSNGYYGGRLDSVREIDALPENCFEITADYSAGE